MTEPKPDTLQNDIDRLVGGELDKPAVRGLVERLDADVDGWKRCALAYMEAQSWQRTFGSLVADDKGVHAEPAVAMAAVVSHASHTHRRALAACLVVAFVLGISVTVGWQHLGGNANRSDGIAGPDKPNDTSSQRDGQSPNVAKKPADRPIVGLVKVSANGVTESAFAVLGVKDRDIENVNFAPEGLTEYDRQLWERRGYRVEQHRKVVSVLLAGGHRLQFPIDFTNYRYVGERVY